MHEGDDNHNAAYNNKENEDSNYENKRLCHWLQTMTV